MNANRLISMAINMILRRVMRGGINAGMNAMANRRKDQAPDAPGQPRQSRQGGPDTRALQKKAQKTIRLGRRLGRF
ncbi:MAG: hypothetical protein AAF382_13735 [Pseudomonadota bacterium]